MLSLFPNTIFNGKFENGYDVDDDKKFECEQSNHALAAIREEEEEEDGREKAIPKPCT
jgi:hypothetical protein